MPIPYEPLGELVERDDLSRADFEAATNSISDQSFDAEYGPAIVMVSMEDTVVGHVKDRRRDVRAAKWRLLATSRHIRKSVDERDAAAAPVPRKRFSGDQLFAIFVTLYLLLSLGLLDFTVAQVILAERVFAGVGKDLWKAMLVSGVLLSGFLLVPLTIARCISLSRVRLGYLWAANVAAVSSAVMFMDNLWLHHDVIATRTQMARSGTGDLSDLANFSLNISRLEGALMMLAIAGEALGAIAIKLNVDFARGVHLKYRLVPNPERAAADAEVAAARAQLTRSETELGELDVLATQLERGREIHRIRCRTFIETLRRDIDVMTRSGVRSLHRQARRNPRDFR